MVRSAQQMLSPAVYVLQNHKIQLPFWVFVSKKKRRGVLVVVACWIRGSNPVLRAAAATRRQENWSLLWAFLR